MSDISTAIAEAIRNRATSTTLVTYSFFWLAWHWQGLEVLLFTDETKIYEKFGYLKNEYLNVYFFGWHGWETIIGILAPLILTVMFIWPFQKFVLIHAYSLEQTARVERKKVKLRSERNIEIYKAALLAQESKKINAQSKKVEAEVKLSETRKRAARTDPTIIWAEDYERFRRSNFYKDFKDIREAVYEHSGRMYVGAYENEGRAFNLSSSLLAYADTEGLIVIDQKSRLISLTDKGKYFIKLYQQELSI